MDNEQNQMNNEQNKSRRGRKPSKIEIPTEPFTVSDLAKRNGVSRATANTFCKAGVRVGKLTELSSAARKTVGPKPRMFAPQLAAKGTEIHEL